jgi:hypothetical protein
LSKDRQRLGNRSGDGTKLVVTVNPSALLRIEDEKDKHAAYCDFVADLKAARRRRQSRRTEALNQLGLL